MGRHLAKPLLDNVLLPHGALTEASKPSDWLPGIGAWSARVPSPAEATAGARPAHRARSGRSAGGPGPASCGPLVAAPGRLGDAPPPVHPRPPGRLGAGQGPDRHPAPDVREAARPAAALHHDAAAETSSRDHPRHLRRPGALSLAFGEVIQRRDDLVGKPALLSISWRLALISLALAPPLVRVISVFGQRIRDRAAPPGDKRRGHPAPGPDPRRHQGDQGVSRRALEDRGFRRSRGGCSRARCRWCATGWSPGAWSRRSTTPSTVDARAGGPGWRCEGLGAHDRLVAAFAAVLTTSYKPVRGLAKDWIRLKDALPSAERFFELLDAATPSGPARRRARRPAPALRAPRKSASPTAASRCSTRLVEARRRGGGAGRPHGRRQDHADRPAAALHDPDAGCIELDGVDLRRVERDSLLAQIAVVTQEPFLFDGTIRENMLSAGRARARSRSWRPRAPPTSTSSRPSCPRATRRRSARSACGSRAASASASRSRARSCAIPRS